MSRSEALFDAARRVIAGGVNSPVRAFKGVGGTPVFFRRGQGAYLFDEDGRRYIDYVGSWGPLIRPCASRRGRRGDRGRRPGSASVRRQTRSGIAENLRSCRPSSGCAW